MACIRCAHQHLKKNKDDISHLEGKIVTIIEDVSPRGRANYKSVSWAAESDDTLHIGESARIVRIHGSTLYLEAIKER
ncbi:MAG: NfeD family protein [Mariprofundaceae bacterium]|nr:NfeD family protein [Mariprofundaceae bacterium]